MTKDNLPEELILQLSKSRPRKELKEKVLDLFTKNPETIFTVDDVLVGLYRENNVVFDKDDIYAVLGRLKKTGFLSRLTIGLYQLKK